MNYKSCKIWTDGGCSPNPGKMSCGIVIKSNSLKKDIHVNSEFTYGTNNISEYLAVLIAIKKAKSLGFNQIEINSDSKLVVKGLNGNWKIKHPNIKPIWKKIKKEIQGIKFFIKWIPREENEVADSLTH